VDETSFVAITESSRVLMDRDTGMSAVASRQAAITALRTYSILAREKVEDVRGGGDTALINFVTLFGETEKKQKLSPDNADAPPGTFKASDFNVFEHYKEVVHTLEKKYLTGINRYLLDALAKTVESGKTVLTRMNANDAKLADDSDISPSDRALVGFNSKVLGLESRPDYFSSIAVGFADFSVLEPHVVERAEAVVRENLEVVTEAQITATLVSQGKPTKQSSTISNHGGGASSRAVDGNSNQAWSASSCTHTENEWDAWWQVDLEGRHSVSTVEVWNRKDCCGDRLDGFTVTVSDTDDEFSGTYCGSEHKIAQGEVKKVECKGHTGKYVRINLHKQAPLTLCEVKVMGTKVPELKAGAAPEPQMLISQGKPTSQSSLYHGYGGGPSDRAVDGKTDQHWGGASCTHTEQEAKPWWSVDLQAPYSVGYVRVFNRADCCGERLNGFMINVSENKKPGIEDEACAATMENTEGRNAIKQGEAKTVNCEGKKGQFVTVSNYKTMLTICEVEVFGTFSKPADYIGCFKDDAKRDFAHGPKQYGFSMESCQKACYEYKFIALQNNGFCTCDNTYSTPKSYTQVQNSECGTTLLGGQWRNAVYKHSHYKEPECVAKESLFVGDSCSGDDCTSSVSCPGDQTPVECKTMGSSDGDGAYWATSDSGLLKCVAQGGGDGVDIQAQITCTTCGTVTSVQSSGETYLDNQEVKAVCPVGTHTVDCTCTSAWGAKDICPGTKAGRFHPVHDGCYLKIPQSPGRRRNHAGGAGAKVMALCNTDKSCRERIVTSESQVCLGDDCKAKVSCPAGTTPIKCRTIGDSDGDGAYVDENGQCIAQGSGPAISAQVVCKNCGHTTSSHKTHHHYLDDQVVTAECPKGSDVIDCNCVSAWTAKAICPGAEKGGFAPKGGKCSLKIPPSPGRRRGVGWGAGAQIAALCKWDPHPTEGPPETEGPPGAMDTFHTDPIPNDHAHPPVDDEIHHDHSDDPPPADELSKSNEDSLPPGMAEDPDMAPPGEDMAPPGEDMAPPGEDMAPPGEDVAAPGEDMAPPGEDMAPPGEDMAPPGEDGPLHAGYGDAVYSESQDMQPPGDDYTPPMMSHEVPQGAENPDMPPDKDHEFHLHAPGEDTPPSEDAPPLETLDDMLDTPVAHSEAEVFHDVSQTLNGDAAGDASPPSFDEAENEFPTVTPLSTALPTEAESYEQYEAPPPTR